MAGTLIDVAKWWAIERPDHPAVVTSDARVSHGELDRWASAIGGWLANNGLEQGDRVSIIANNSLEWCVMARAVLYAGGLAAPVNPRFTLSEATYMVERYEPKFIFYDDARAELAQSLGARYPAIRFAPLAIVHELRGAPPAAAPGLDIVPDTYAVIIATSGSTGYPKGVIYSHRSMIGGVANFAISEPYAADDPRALVFGPMCTSAGYVVFSQVIAHGGTAYIEESFDPAKALKTIIEEKITMLMGTPIFFERIAACPEFSDADLSFIRMLQTGGARVSQALLDTWTQKGVVMRQMYGQTEAGGIATINSLSDAMKNPEKCGRGMPLTQLRTIDEKGHFCKPNEAGEIVIKGPGIMVGYWRDVEGTEKTLVNGWLRTGDLGVIDEEGRLTMLDRLKDIIISGGLNISALELERVIAEHPDVEEVAVIAAKDDRFGETPLAVIYSRKSIVEADIVAHCGQHLSDYKQVRYITFEKEPLPRLATGKISKPALRQRYADAHLTLAKVR